MRLNQRAFSMEIVYVTYVSMYHSAWAVQRHRQCHNLYIALLQTATSALQLIIHWLRFCRPQRVHYKL